MGFYNFEEVYFQQKKRTTKMRINQENVDNIKRIKLPDFDDEERDTIQGLHKILLKRSMVKNNSKDFQGLTLWSTTKKDKAELKDL